MDVTAAGIELILADLERIGIQNTPVCWSDEYFKARFMEKNKLAGRLDLHQTREYAKAFLNWYISGKGGGKLLDIWIGIVGGMLVPTTSISQDRLLIDSMFRGKIGENGAFKLDPLEGISKLTDFIYTNESTGFSSLEAKTWYTHLYEMLDKKQSHLNTNAVNPSVIVAINYLGYIALSLLKVLVKEKSKICQFITKHVTNEYNSFWHTRSTDLVIKTRTPPPHKYAFQQFEHAFQKTSPNCIKVLTLVVGTYMYTESYYKLDIQKVLKTSCLDYLNLYGMGCLYWLKKAQESCPASSEDLMDCMASSSNRATNQALRQVLNHYEPNQCSWRWARLFVDQIFIDISTSKNPQYAATMAAIHCNCNDESPIWKISQFNDKNLKATAISTAHQIAKVLKKDLPSGWPI